MLNKYNAELLAGAAAVWQYYVANIIMCVKKFCVSVALHYLCRQIVFVRLLFAALAEGFSVNLKFKVNKYNGTRRCF